MPSIAKECGQCKKYSEIPILPQQPIVCPHCSKEWGTIQNSESIFNECPFCTCRQFYVQKDFNQGIGCFIMLLGIVLVPKTFGLSLPFFAAVDWLLYKKVKSMALCYRCGTEFRGFHIPEHFKSFMHHIGMKYDKYRA